MSWADVALKVIQLGVKLLDHAGSKLPKPVTVRAWHRQPDDMAEVYGWQKKKP